MFRIGEGNLPLPQPPPPWQGEGDTLTIAAAGDVNVTQALLDSTRGADGSYDFSRMILGAAPLLSGADLTVADLEVNFCGAPYDPAAYNAPESLLTALSGPVWIWSKRPIP